MKISEIQRGATLKDVAKLAGVAPVTVSYVLNNKSKSIGEATRARVWAAAREIGYRPNMAARSLVTKRTNVIALWVPDVASAFSARVIAEIQKHTRRSGYELLISEIHWQQEPDFPLPDKTMPSGNVDGVIAFLTSSCRNVHLDLPAATQMPTVILGSFPQSDCDYVGVEILSAAQKAMDWLLAQNRRRIGYLVPEQANFSDDERHEVYNSAMKNAELAPISIPMAHNSRSAARQALAQFLAVHPAPDALFCYNDDSAIGAFRALKDAGLRVPNDVILVGCDGIEDIEYLGWPLPTIALPLAPMCAQAWQFLESRLDQPALEPQTQIFSSHLNLVEM